MLLISISSNASPDCPLLHSLYLEREWDCRCII